MITASVIYLNEPQDAHLILYFQKGRSFEGGRSFKPGVLLKKFKVGTS